MKKVFGKKLLVPIMAMLLCVAVAFGTVAVADGTSGGNQIIINVNADDTVKKYIVEDEEEQKNVEDAIYLGEGTNEWDMILGPDAVLQTGMSDAYFEVTAQRILKTKPNMVRLMIQPYYLTFIDDEDIGQGRWEKGELNYDSAYMYNFWRYLEVFQAAGTAVMLNYGFTTPKPMHTWFCIKDVPTHERQIQLFGHAGTSAPRDLETFAKNLGILLKECERRGFIAPTVDPDTQKTLTGIERRQKSTIQYINFYNEVQGPAEYTTFGDKRVYWCRMLQYVHEVLQDNGYRSKTDEALNNRELHSILIVGVDTTDSGATFGDNTRMFIDYLYTNAYLKGYCDTFDTHQYFNWGKSSKQNRGIAAAQTTAYATERWPMYIKGTYNILMAEHGSAESGANLTASADGMEKYSGLATPFDGSTVSQAIGFSLGGCMGTLTWFPHDFFFPRNPNFLNSSFTNLWAVPSSSTVENGVVTAVKSSGKIFGIEGVNSNYGESIFMRYLPDNAKVAKSTVDATNTDYVRLASYLNDTDTAVVAEFDCIGGTKTDGTTPEFSYSEYKKDSSYKERTVRINLGDRNGTYYKYTHEYVENSFTTSLESQTVYDGNAILPDGELMVVKKDANGYYIEDTISANHCLVVYSTVEPMQQIALTGERSANGLTVTNSSREIVYDLANADHANNGVTIKVDTEKSVRLPNDAKFEFDVFRGVVDPFEEGQAPKYLAASDGFNNAKLEKTYFNTNCSEYKASNYNEETQVYSGETLNKRAGVIASVSADTTSAVYKCAADAKAGDTVAVRVKLKGDSKLLGTQQAGISQNSVLQIYDTDVYAISIIRIIDSSAK